MDVILVLILLALPLSLMAQAGYINRRRNRRRSVAANPNSAKAAL